MRNENLDLYTKITLLLNWGSSVLSLKSEARKEDLKELILLGKELEDKMENGGGLFPLYLRALDSLREHAETLLNLTLEEVEEILHPEDRRPLSWWGIHFSEFYQEALLPWSKTLEVSPALLCGRIPDDLLYSEDLLNSDGSWNSSLTREELCEIFNSNTLLK